MASGFHEDYINGVIDAIVNAGEGGSGWYIVNGGGSNIIAADPWICLLDTTWTASVNASTNEVSGGSYARQQAEFSTAASASSDNDADIDFTNMPTVNVYSVGICATTTELTNDIIIGGEVTGSPKAVTSGDTFRISAGNLTVSLT